MKKYALLASVAIALSLGACGKPAATETETATGADAATGVDAMGNAAQDAVGAAQGAAVVATASSPADYVTQAALADMFEIEAGKIAAKKATNPEIKTFAQMMVKDHTATSAALKPLAKAQSLTIPVALDQRHLDMIDNLNTASVADFDKKYLDQQNTVHSEALTLHTNFSKGNDVPDLRKFAMQTAPKVQAHLDKLKVLDTSGADNTVKTP
jgi:putative membrane protein